MNLGKTSLVVAQTRREATSWLLGLGPDWWAPTNLEILNRLTYRIPLLSILSALSVMTYIALGAKALGPPDRVDIVVAGRLALRWFAGEGMASAYFPGPADPPETWMCLVAKAETGLEDMVYAVPDQPWDAVQALLSLTASLN